MEATEESHPSIIFQRVPVQEDAEVEETQQSNGLHETQAAYPYLSHIEATAGPPRRKLCGRPADKATPGDQAYGAAAAREQQHVLVPSSPFLPPPLLLVHVAAAKRPAEQWEAVGLDPGKRVTSLPFALGSQA